MRITASVCAAMLAFVLLLHAAPPCWSDQPAKSIQGVWLSPDWILPGTQTYTEATVRPIVHNAVESLKKQGIKTIFMETLNRGTSIAYGDGLPMYPHLVWDFARHEPQQQVVDTLQILIEEAKQQDIAVHAWIHCFYWRMDNDDVLKPWQRAKSMWDDLLIDYIELCTARLHDEQRLPAFQRALREIAQSIRDNGVDGPALSTILRQAGYEPLGRPLGRVMHDLMLAGCPPPDFMLISSADDPFPRTPHRMLRPIYLNPACPRVQKRILDAIGAISKGHPELAGIHLDHIRFPTEGQGIPLEWEPRGRDAVYFNQNNPIMAERYRLYADLVSTRRAVLTDLVNQVRARMADKQELSAAVLPLYYVERSDGIDRFNGYDYSGQDWHSWNVDFVVPMMYGFDPWRIRTLIHRFDNEVKAIATDRPAPSIVPGVSKLSMAQSGLLGDDDWVFFDLSFGLDTHYEREHDEDYNWSPRKDL